jgi:hypothetical protein
MNATTTERREKALASFKAEFPTVTKVRQELSIEKMISRFPLLGDIDKPYALEAFTFAIDTYKSQHQGKSDIKKYDTLFLWEKNK